MSEKALVSETEPISRRDVLRSAGIAAGIGVLAPRLVAAQTAQAASSAPPVPASTPRDYSSGAPPVNYPDPDILTLDPAFNALRVNNTAIQRLWTGGLWCEGPAWSSQGRYLVWSDIPNNRQMRWMEDDGRVTVFRMPSNNSNGNTFDYQGRQVSCEHAMRRVVRYEHDGSMTVLADRYNGMRLNSPNDLAPHPDGSLWFTDPPFGGSLYEGAPDPAGGPGNVAGRINSRVGQLPGYGETKRELTASNVYRVDANGKIELVISQEALGGAPNGIAFSPDHKKVYIVTQGIVVSFDVGSDNKVSNRKQLSDFMIEGVRCSTDGIRVDVNGNLWCGSNAARNAGYSGVTVWSPEGKALGRIRLPEACANVTFGGPKRNRLFMAASQSLYAVYVNTQGASPG
jgi:gluconolactonase